MAKVPKGSLREIHIDVGSHNKYPAPDELPFTVQQHVQMLLMEYRNYGKAAAEEMYKEIIKKSKLTVAQSSILAQLFQEQAGLTKHRRKNPAPRIGTARPGRASQVTKKKPSPRLMARRKSNTRKGYFPNPTIERESKKFLIEEIESHLAGAVNLPSVRWRQASLSYAMGAMKAGAIVNVITPAEYEHFYSRAKKIAGE